MLELRDLSVFYRSYRAVSDLSLSIPSGRAVGITGENGAGKTSTLKGILGLEEATGGVRFKGEALDGLETNGRIKAGIGYLPQDNRVFGSMTVEDNIKAATRGRDYGSVKEEVIKLFPRLEGHFDQRGSKLSGGEQTMLAGARVLVNDPELFLLDEPTEGLMQEIEERLLELLQERINQGKSVLLTGQNLDFMKELVSEIILLENGTVKDRAST
jgi:branched-chain amino acid transport system ATP-binding protein